MLRFENLTIFIIFICSCCVLTQSQIFRNPLQSNLPKIVRLGSAIIAAAEEDDEKETQRLQQQELDQQQIESLYVQNSTHIEEALMNVLKNLFNETVSQVVPRGKQHKQHKKLMKYVYPLLMGVFLAKMVLVPLLLKLLTAISTSSFVMSKISLAASALLFLKWIIGSANNAEPKERVAIIQLPLIKGSTAADAAIAAGSPSNVWSDTSWSGNNLYQLKAKYNRHNYIPLASNKENIYTTATNTYRYPKPNYKATNYDNKPFL